jgi:hypothetical protein
MISWLVTEVREALRRPVCSSRREGIRRHLVFPYNFSIKRYFISSGSHLNHLCVSSVFPLCLCGEGNLCRAAVMRKQPEDDFFHPHAIANNRSAACLR